MPTSYILPPGLSAAVSEGRRSSLADLPGGKETILLVEDEDAVRELLLRLLQKLGYTVHAAASGLAACDFLSAGGAPQVDLLMSDIRMPQMGGEELARWLFERQPQARVLFMSGHGETLPAHCEVSTCHCGFMAKPFTPAFVARRVREMLDLPGLGC